LSKAAKKQVSLAPNMIQDILSWLVTGAASQAMKPAVASSAKSIVEQYHSSIQHTKIQYTSLKEQNNICIIIKTRH